MSKRVVPPIGENSIYSPHQINRFRSRAEKTLYFPSIKKKNKIGFFLRAGAIAPKGKHVFHITFACMRCFARYEQNMGEVSRGETEPHTRC